MERGAVYNIVPSVEKIKVYSRNSGDEFINTPITIIDEKGRIRWKHYLLHHISQSQKRY
jgi:hypothetical protein